MRIHWRKVLWVYRSADDGWCVFIFKRGYHVTPISNNDRRVLLDFDY
jgi:hypothetical protein